MRFTSHLLHRFGLTATLVALLCASSIFTANAQIANCFGLAAADCQLVASADKNISQETSFNQTFETSATLKTATQTTTLSATGGGLFALDSAALSGTADQAAVFNALKMTFNVSGSVKTTGSSASTQSGKANFVVLNGELYAQATDSTGTLSPWQSISLAQAAAAGSGSGSSNNASNPALAFFQDPAVIQAIVSAPNIKGFIVGKKTANVPIVDGQRQTELVYTFDAKTLVTSPTMYPVIKALLKAGNANYSGATNAQMQSNALTLAAALQGTTFKVTRWIGTKDKLYHALGIDGVFKLTSLVAAQSGSATFHLLVKLSKVGQSITVNAPIAVSQPTPSKSTPTNNAGSNANPTSTPSANTIDAFIPDTVTSRYAGIPFGKTASSAYPASFASLGNPTAPLKITQLSSYSCGSCENYYSSVIVNLLPQIKAGQIYYVFIPVTLTGEFDAKPGTAAALCALDQNKFWQMHDVLFDWQLRYNSDAANIQRLQAAALKLGLDVTKFNTCLTSQATSQKINAANAYFKTLGLSSTPSILINGKPADTPPTLSDILGLLDGSAPPLPTIPGTLL